MRALIQRVTSASVTVDEQTIGQIDHGLLILLGIGQNDSELEIKNLVHKIVHLRIFNDDDDKMNRSLLDIHGKALVVSQFTLYADIRKGRRPSFTAAAPPALAEPLVARFKDTISSYGIQVEGGVFGAHMEVNLVNNGPVTIWLDSDDL